MNCLWFHGVCAFAAYASTSFMLEVKPWTASSLIEAVCFFPVGPSIVTFVRPTFTTLPKQPLSKWTGLPHHNAQTNSPIWGLVVWFLIAFMLYLLLRFVYLFNLSTVYGKGLVTSTPFCEFFEKKKGPIGPFFCLT